MQVGKTPMGGSYPIRLQSMTTTATTDVEGSVEQCIRIVRSGADYVRLTTQGLREVESLKEVHARLRAMRYYTPLIADVHFNADVADAVAGVVEKVRINPGNYVASRRPVGGGAYTDDEYREELRRLEERFRHLIGICRQRHVSIRVGVNHGSLSGRITARYGDNPRGIVESCMEFLRVCKRELFRDVVVSIKASDVAVMVRSVRLLVATMDGEGMHFPIHLGVTEAGEGEEGRIKSAVGIGALLSDGIGDTIRVSLSEAPEREIPVARKLRDYIKLRAGSRPQGGRMSPSFNYLDPQRRPTRAVGGVGGTCKPIVIGEAGERSAAALLPDYIYCGDSLPKAAKRIEGVGYIVDAGVWKGEPGTYPCFTYQMLSQVMVYEATMKWMFLPCNALNEELIACLRSHPELVVIAQPTSQNPVGEVRALIHRMMNKSLLNPVVMFVAYSHGMPEIEDLRLESAADLGAPLLDCILDGIYISCESSSGSRPIPADAVDSLSFGLLQAVGQRLTKVEYISCPGCGRTLYDLQTTVLRIKEATRGLRGLKIAVMGCIVNGPGEMADADYGYVGAGRGKVSLYRGRECVEPSIDEAEAVEHLLRLIAADRRAASV